MEILLRLTLAGLFIGLAVFTFMNPLEAKEYVNVRYKLAYQNLISETFAAKYIPGNLIGNLPTYVPNIGAGIFIVMAVCALLGCKICFSIFSFLFIAVGVFLHLPYQSNLEYITFASQVRKLLLLFALFCATLALPSGCCCCCKNGKCGKPADKDLKPKD